MGKVVDFTDKLSFDGNPTLVVKGKNRVKLPCFALIPLQTARYAPRQ